MSAGNNTFTDEELMLLEQLCYLDEDVCAAAGVKPVNFSRSENDTLEVVLKCFDSEKIDSLRNYNNKGVIQ